MKLEVQKYLEQYGLEKLKEEFSIIVVDYPDRISLNYDQINSPKFHPICDECRGLILRKGTWEILCWPFRRFYNAMEDKETSTFPISKAQILEKIDGSLLLYNFDGEKWFCSTRKMCNAEGLTPSGISFAQLFSQAASKTKLKEYVMGIESAKFYTWIFELVSPESRVVHPYPEREIYLIGARNKSTGNEVSGKELDEIAKVICIKRPLSYKFTTIKETIEAASKLNVMDEGFVLVYEKSDNFWRLKIKNEKFLAIAHMRENGGISAKRIMTLMLSGDVAEYLNYFKEDTKYVEFVESVFNESLTRIKEIGNKYLGIPVQKDFALTIIPLTKYSYEKSILFEMRKGRDIMEVIRERGSKKIAESLGLREKLKEKFEIKELDNEEEL